MYERILVECRGPPEEIDIAGSKDSDWSAGGENKSRSSRTEHALIAPLVLARARFHAHNPNSRVVPGHAFALTIELARTHALRVQVISLRFHFILAASMHHARRSAIDYQYWHYSR